MGAWGPGIFSDDVACEVRSSYRELLEDGLERSEATRLLLEKFGDYLNDPDDELAFWLALAAAQWRLGRLEDHVRNRAIEIIDSGIGLDRWEEAGASALTARKKALYKLREQLTSPQPAAKKVKKPWRYVTDLSVGDAISYRLESGKFVIFRVVGLETHRYWSAPILELCDWVGETLPSTKVIQRLPYIIQEDSMVDTSEQTIVPHKKSAYPADRIEVIARGLQVRRVTKSYATSTWLGTDGWLNSIAGQLSTKQPILRLHPYRVLRRY